MIKYKKKLENLNLDLTASIVAPSLGKVNDSTISDNLEFINNYIEENYLLI